MIAIACEEVCDGIHLNYVPVLQKRFCCSDLQVPDVWISGTQTKLTALNIKISFSSM